ncbi:High-affinity branched-chain amino acid transport system permease protein LivH [Candidatus Burkholderia pumila]|uniref:High-affinity branched-chain amino acid transport system permease protein LivH n=1 Tax=Candidatus Burkholderia pumila TaxID=1090375 RepID=A0ABR5HLA2_9BURK|nr:High-affinity branched-chain amino acid transport system permease protein LivH [Candidatus Burkholderia pumila]
MTMGANPDAVLIAGAGTLLLIVAVHFAMVGLGIVMFGAEGSRTTAFSDATFNIGTVSISGQSLRVVGTAVVLIVTLYFYFDRSISGKALRATSVNRLGAQLVGIGMTQAVRLVGLLESYSSFWASAFIRIREVIVFTLIIPVLLWRSLANPHSDEDEE